MSDAQRKDAVSSLVNLYTVVIGVALSLAVVGLIERDDGLTSLTGYSCLLFLAFIATLLPLYHGAMRHLFDAYVAGAAQRPRTGALIFEFLLLFVHALAFVVLALLLEKPGHFAWVLVGLLSIDILWAIFAHFSSSDRDSFSAPGRWALINIFFVGLSLWFLVEKDYYLQDITDPLKLALPIALGTIARTLVDYVWCRHFYFPK